MLGVQSKSKSHPCLQEAYILYIHPLTVGYTPRLMDWALSFFFSSILLCGDLINSHGFKLYCLYSALTFLLIPYPYSKCLSPAKLTVFYLTPLCLLNFPITIEDTTILDAQLRSLQPWSPYISDQLQNIISIYKTSLTCSIPPHFLHSYHPSQVLTTSWLN